MAREQSPGGLRIIVFLVIGAVAAVALVFLVVNIMRNYEQRIAEASAPVETVYAMVASRDLYQGVVITEEDIFPFAVPADMLEPTVYRSPEHVVGRIPRERILVDEYVRVERLADADEGIGLNAIIPRGQRAISININDGNALSGHLAPSNYVDVLVTIRDEDDRDKRYTKTLLQAVYVLAVNSRNSASRRGEVDPEEEREAARRYRPSVTLAVTPEQAQEVAHGADQGEITLALRSQQDISYEETDGVTTRDITGEVAARPTPRPRPTAAPEPTGSVLQIIRGTNVNEVELDDNRPIPVP